MSICSNTVIMLGRTLLLIIPSARLLVIPGGFAEGSDVCPAWALQRVVGGLAPGEPNGPHKMFAIYHIPVNSQSNRLSCCLASHIRGIWDLKVHI